MKKLWTKTNVFSIIEIESGRNWLRLKVMYKTLFAMK